MPCLRELYFSYPGVLGPFCADTFVVVYLGWYRTIGLAHPSATDAMVPFAGFAFWPTLFFSLWLVGHGHFSIANGGLPGMGA